MQRQFNRIATVTFGPVGASQLVVRGLRIAFNIQMTQTSESNKGSIDVFNLSTESRNKIRELDQVVNLSAGYSDGAGELGLFIGNISRINHSLTPPEIISRIEASDGEKAIREQKFSLSYNEGFSVKQILSDISTKMGVPIRTDLSLIPFTDQTFENGYAFVGQAKNALDTLTESVGLTWSFQRGELKFQLANRGDDSLPIDVREETGLLGSPEKLERIGSGAQSDKKPGWKIRTLLQPKAEPGGLISVSSREITAGTIFKIEEVEHRGDTYGDIWQSVMKVIEPS